MNKMLLPIIALTIALASPAFGQLEIAEQIDIKAIESMQVYKNGDKFMAKVQVLFSNDHEKNIRLKNGDFNVSIKKAGSAGIHLGRGEVAELVIPANNKQSYSLDLFVGYGADAIGRILQVFNIVGNPDIKPIMTLEGESDFGIQSKRGWISSKSLSIEWDFTPKLQNEVLFQ